MLEFVDTHAHLYDKKFSAILPKVIERSLNANVKQVYLPNLTVDTIEPMIAVEKRYPDLCRSMLGLHPCEVREDFKVQLDAMTGWFSKHDFVAIGEVGLDLYWEKVHFEAQKAALHIAIDWALHYDLPLVLHARESLSELISLIKGRGKPSLRGIFHCFSGSVKQAQMVVKMGFHLGIGGMITFSRGNMESVVKAIELSHLVLETDSPYLAPTPYRGRCNQPVYLPLIAARIAEIKEISIAVVAAKTTSNAAEIFGRWKDLESAKC